MTRLLKNSTTLLLLIAVSLLIVWTTDFHKWACTGAPHTRSTNNGQQFRQKTLTQRPTELAVSPANTTTTTLSKHFGDDFKSGIQASDTVLKYTFRANIPLKDSDLIRNSDYFRPRSHVVNPLVTRYMIEPSGDLCDGAEGPPFLLIMVPSLARHAGLRETIRETWGSVVGVNGTWPGTSNMAPVRLVFVFGRSDTEEELSLLTNESRAHGDVLYADFVDSYRNLTYKSLTSLYWAATRCPRVRFVMKVDEDTFVNAPYLLEFLRYHGPDLKRTVLGYGIPRPVTVRKGKWAVDVAAYPLAVFPRYLYGHSYVITGDVVGDLARASQYIPFIPVEDALVTGVLASVVNATRLHNPLFAVSAPSYTCAVVRNVKISITKISASHHHAIWRALREGNCSYVYFPRPVSSSKIHTSLKLNYTSFKKG